MTYMQPRKPSKRKMQATTEKHAKEESEQEKYTSLVSQVPEELYVTPAKMIHGTC
jgi:hypothetical protein